MAPASITREQTEEAFLDAAERLLIAVGHDGITTRRVAQEAGVNHGLVHYYFGSMENLLARTMYAAPGVPYIQKWGAAMRYLDADRDYQKVWLELQALAWNRPELRERYAIEMPLDALVSLVITFSEGIILERLSGVEAGQAALLACIDDWVTRRDGR